MDSQKSTLATPAPKMPTNRPIAERIIVVFSMIMFIGGLLAGAVFIALGFDERSFDSYESGNTYLMTGAATAFFAILQWAFIRIIINISYNLFNVRNFTGKRFTDKL